MITRPLELESRLSRPPRDLDFVAWVNVALVVLFFSLLGSRFVLAPGLLIGTDGEKFELSKTAASQYSRTASIVVSYRRDDVILFEGAIIKLPELQQRLTDYAKKHPGQVLLLIADRQVTLDAVAKLSEMARSVGFAYVQTATERLDSDTEIDAPPK
jgi:biopolymer transport protein ExbD